LLVEESAFSKHNNRVCLYIEMRFVPFECMCHKTQISIVQHFLLCFLPESKHRFSHIQKKNAACREEMFLMCLEACDIEPFNTRAGKQRSQCRVMFCALFFSASTLSSPHCQPFLCGSVQALTARTCKAQNY
jgi:hypothetical protein